MSSVAVDGDAVYVATNSRLFQVDRATGVKQWEVTTSPNPIAITPAIAGGRRRPGRSSGVASGELMIPREEVHLPRARSPPTRWPTARSTGRCG